MHPKRSSGGRRSPGMAESGALAQRSRRQPGSQQEGRRSRLVVRHREAAGHMVLLVAVRRRELPGERRMVPVGEAVRRTGPGEEHRMVRVVGVRRRELVAVRRIVAGDSRRAAGEGTGPGEAAGSNRPAAVGVLLDG